MNERLASLFNVTSDKDRDGRVCGIIGQTGSGKNVLAQNILAHTSVATKGRVKFWINDFGPAASGQYLKGEWNKDKTRFQHDVGSLPLHLCRRYESREQFDRFYKQDLKDPVCFFLFSGEEWDMDEWIELAFEVGGCTLVVSELADYCSKSYISKQLARLVSRGRHIGDGVSLMWDSQKLQQIHNEVLSASRTIFLLRSGTKVDFDTLQRYFGDIPRDQMSQFSPGQFIRKDDGVVYSGANPFVVSEFTKAQ